MSDTSTPHLPNHEHSLDSILRSYVTSHYSRRVANDHHGQDEARTGLARLPAEVLHLICAQLCLCSSCGPKRDPFDDTPLRTVQFKDDLDSLSRTCKFIRKVAQPYVFHVFGSWTRLFTLRLTLKLYFRTPHVAGQVRRITLNSIWGELGLLSILTGLHTLRVFAIKAGGIGAESYLSFPCLAEVCYGPNLDTTSIVSMEDAGTDLRAIFNAAKEKLSYLRCHRLCHNLSISPLIPWKLSADHITTLDLHQCWLPHETFKRFITDFPSLKSFRFKTTLRLRSRSGEYEQFSEDGPERLADATDGESPPCDSLEMCTTIS